MPDEETLAAGQLWRHQVSDAAIILSSKLASHQAACVDDRGEMHFINDLLDPNEWELILVNDDRLIEWWDELADAQRREARRLDVSADIPAWMRDTLAGVRIKLKEWKLPVRGDPPIDRIPRVIRDVMADR